jgi:phospholipid/cholesterol/gamma-HCH transport system permease protein
VTPSGRQVAANGRDVAVHRVDERTVAVRLAGIWRLADGLPSLEPVERELAGRPPKTVVFDARDLGAWDTSVVTFIEEISDLCEERQIAVDPSGLPDGIRDLVKLARAVPEKAGARRTSTRPPWLDRVGGRALSAGEAVRNALAFFGEAARSFVRLLTRRARYRRHDLLLVLQSAGAEALPIVTLISVLVGMILAFVGAVQLQRFGAEIYVADLVAIAMVREMGCIMTGIIMAGRTGSGFAAELGTMKVTQEIDALTTLGIPPMDFLVLPRLLALSIMMPLLCIYSDILGIIGGGIVSAGMLDITPVQYVNETLYALSLKSYFMGIGKSFVFGVLIALTGCFRGMQSGNSASAVGDAATSAVVTSIVLIVVADGLFAIVFHLLDI